MAARRLLIIMLVLLGISSVIAIALPKPDRDSSTPSESTTGATGATGESGASGTTGATGSTGDKGEPESVSTTEVVSVDLDAKKPAEIEAEPGTRMIVSVSSKDGSEVEISGLGLAGFADQYAPAVFDLILPPQPGEFQVRAPGEKPDAVISTAG